MRFASTVLPSLALAALLAAGCAGGSRAKGTVATGLPRHDEFFRRTQALLARVERAEAAAQSPLLRAPPAGVRIRIAGEGPEARVDVGGDADPALLLRVVGAADDLAAAPPQMDAVPIEAAQLTAESKRLSIEVFGVPGSRGSRLRQAYGEALRLLGELPERARRAGAWSRQLLGLFRG